MSSTEGMEREKAELEGTERGCAAIPGRTLIGRASSRVFWVGSSWNVA